MRRTLLLLALFTVACSRATDSGSSDGGTWDAGGDAGADLGFGFDAGPSDAGGDSGATIDGGGAGYDGVGCGFSGQTCDLASGCCGVTATCDPSCATGTFACDGPEDCGPGTVCCLEFFGSTLQASSSQCLSTCQTGAIRYDACHVAEDCEVGESCCDSLGGPTNLGGPYGVCLPGGCPD